VERLKKIIEESDSEDYPMATTTTKESSQVRRRQVAKPEKQSLRGVSVRG